jgi:hypothetical protein
MQASIGCLYFYKGMVIISYSVFIGNEAINFSPSVVVMNVCVCVHGKQAPPGSILSDLGAEGETWINEPIGTTNFWYNFPRL